MRVTVKLFALLRDRANRGEISLDLADGATVSVALIQISQLAPSIRQHLPRVATAVNREYVKPDHILRSGDELALIPPVSGGSSREDWIEIHDAPLAVAPVIRFVSDVSVGGIDVFLGTTRAEISPQGQQLVALDYEAYTDMALARLRELAARARQQWPIVRVAILHRVGRVAIAEPSVIIAVSCPHRAESFAACKWLIDQLKMDVPIWKKEIWEDGTGTWAGNKD